jgi:hypothetical protein
VRYHFLRDNIEKGKIALIHVPTHDQLANIFTKSLDQTTFTHLWLKNATWWNSEPTMQEGLQLPAPLEKIKALKKAGLRAKHVPFSFMKRRVQPLMARDHLDYEYTGTEEIDDDVIIERLGRIFKDMPPFRPCPVE